MSNTPVDSSAYSLHFNKLRLMGAWVVQPKSTYDTNAYALYKTIMTIVASAGCTSLFCDLYMVFGDFRNMTWNLCISTLFTASFVKNLVTIYNSNIIERMRVRLHRDEASGKKTPEDDILHRLSIKELRWVQIFFYGLAGIFVPTWLATFYLGYSRTPKAMPVPLRLPIDIDFEDDFQYNVAFWAVGTAGVMGITLALETELAMFTILIQISREYKRLLKDIAMLNEVYTREEECEGRRGRQYKEEVNPLLRKSKTKSLVKEYSTRQQRLIEYTEDFELSYSPALLLQVFAMSILIIMSAIQCFLEVDNLSINTSYQMGYILLLVSDMFLVCWFVTRLRGQCLRVGEEAYSTLWYRMSSDIQKDICMMIMRSQHPPRITSGKVMELNLHAFMHTLRNIYSWLALFLHLAPKVN